MDRLYGGIEAGGTKFLCMVGTGPDHVLEEARFPTTSPDETIAHAIGFFKPHAQRKALAAVGIGSFGPVDLDRNSKTYGYITTTPKPGWEAVDICGKIQKSLSIPVSMDTDVNAAAFGEHYWIAANRMLDPFLYITVGTGIGVGVLINGRPLHGLIHAEAGHMVIPHDIVNDPFPGICPFHGDCWEGLASGPALARRWGVPAESIGANQKAWDLEAEYIGLALVNMIYTYSPQRIILGGGVIQHEGLLDAVRAKVQKIINGYVHSPMTQEKIAEYIVPPGLGNASGVLGAIAMAMDQQADR